MPAFRPTNPTKHYSLNTQKVKGFYESGRYKNQPKRTSSNGNERMTAADSARFKDFEPQWDKTEVELLPNNEKMLIVPVLRNLQVNYNQSIGFIRRLCIRVDVNEDFLEANIVELVGNLAFVKANHNAIFKDYKENNISGFSGVMATYEIDYNNVTTKNFDNGINTTCNNCLVSGTDPCTYFSNGYIEIIYCYYGDGGVSTPPLPPLPPTPQGNLYPIINYPVTNNPNTGNNPSHGGGGIGSTGGNNNNGNGISDGPPPLVFLPMPFVRGDYGTSWGSDWGDGIPRDEYGLEIDASGNPDASNENWDNELIAPLEISTSNMPSLPNIQNYDITVSSPDIISPGYPATHPVYTAIFNFNNFILYALEGSRNFSTISMHNAAKYFKDSSAIKLGDYRKGIGACGEGIGACGEGISADGIYRNLQNNPLTIGNGVVLPNGFISPSRTLQHDVILGTPLTAMPFINGSFELAVNYTDIQGNAQATRISSNGIFLGPIKYGVTSYEIKTANPLPAYATSGLILFRNGITDAIARASEADVAILVFDYNTFQTINTVSPTKVAAELARMTNTKNTNNEQKVYLKLERNLYNNVRRAFWAIINRIKDIP